VKALRSHSPDIEEQAEQGGEQQQLHAAEQPLTVALVTGDQFAQAIGRDERKREGGATQDAVPKREIGIQAAESECRDTPEGDLVYERAQDGQRLEVSVGLEDSAQSLIDENVDEVADRYGGEEEPEVHSDQPVRTTSWPQTRSPALGGAKAVASADASPPARGRRRKVPALRAGVGHLFNKGSLSAGPPSAGSFSCPSGQKLVLADVAYTGITLTDTTNNVTASLADITRVFFTF